MSKELAQRLLAGESLPVEQMLYASEGFVELCIEQKKRIEELEDIEMKLREELRTTTGIIEDAGLITPFEDTPDNRQEAHNE